MKINKELIENFLESPDKELSLPMMPIDDIDSILCYELGFSDQGDFETNGWQYDFWKSYSNNSCVLDLSGSLYYGRFKLNKR